MTTISTCPDEAELLPVATGEPADEAPIDGAVEPVHQCPDALGGRCIEQVGPDRGGRVNAEDEDQERGHQRAAADAGHPDEQADAESRSDIKRIDHAHTICSDICGYLMARHFALQCMHRNKNVSAARQGWVEILPMSRA